ncbi:MFS transporter [Streptomyces sp. NPDC053069]|uniref:MFS transporter n=1 Tax=Streptomyces sp. NPDC053069 TaxID=3365695 RepID=UPI0037D4A245
MPDRGPYRLPPTPWESCSRLQWVVAGYTLVFAAGLLSGGLVAGRLGPRRAFCAGMLLFCAGSAFGAFAGDWPRLVTGRLVQGLGAAVLLPAGTALLGHVFPEEKERARALGVRGGAAGLGVALGPAVGGPLVEHLGWRSVLWINLPVGLLLLLLTPLLLPPVPSARQGWDPAGQLLAAVGVGAFVFGLVQGPVDGWSAAPVTGALVLAAVTLPAFVVVESLAVQPMLDLRQLRRRAYAASALSCFASGFGLFGSTFFLTLYLQDVLGWSAGGAGLVFLAVSAVIVPAAPLAGVLCARSGPRLPLTTGLLLIAVSLAGLARYGRHAGFADYGWLLPVLGIATGLAFVPAVITAVQRSNTTGAAVGSALMDSLRELGGVVGVAALGVVLIVRMRHTLFDRAVLAGLPESAAHALTHSALARGPAASLNTAGSTVSARTRTWVADSFIEGLHLCLLCGAATVGCAALAVAFLLRDNHATAASSLLVKQSECSSIPEAP